MPRNTKATVSAPVSTPVQSSGIQSSANNDGKYTREMGCESSYSDAKHDFHVFFDSSTIKDYVEENVPASRVDINCDKTMDEDKFLQKYLVNNIGFPFNL